MVTIAWAIVAGMALIAHNGWMTAVGLVGLIMSIEFGEDDK